jgi:hypothetical protein
MMCERCSKPIAGWCTYADCNILSMPLGPSVLLTKSPTAMAPTKAERRAFSPFSSVTSSAKICVGLLYDCGCVSCRRCFKIYQTTYHLLGFLLPARKQRGISEDVGLKLRCLNATFFEAVPRGSAYRSFAEGTFCCLELPHSLPAVVVGLMLDSCCSTSSTLPVHFGQFIRLQHG